MSNPEKPLSGPRRRRGRPRDGDIDTAVDHAVWALLDELGYEALTFEAVADRANCSRPALYRRWPNKHALVLDVLDRNMGAAAAVRPVTPGEGVEAIFGWLRGLIDFLSGAGRGALLSLSHARRRHPELAASIDRIMVEDRTKFHTELRALLGPEPSEQRLDRMIDTMIGTIFFRVALQDRPMHDAELRLLIAEQSTD